MADGGPIGEPSDNLHVAGLPMQLDDNSLRDLMQQYGTVLQCKVVKKEWATHAAALVRYSSLEEAKSVQASLNGQIINGLTEPVHVRFASGPNGAKGGKGDGKGDGGWGWQGGGKGDSWQSGGGMQGGWDASGKTVSPYDRSASTQMGSGWKGGGKGSISIELVIQSFEGMGALPGGNKWANPSAAVYVAGLPPDTSDIHLYRMLSPFGAILPHGVDAMLNPDGSCKGYAFVNYADQAAADLAIQTMNGALISDGSVLTLSYKRRDKGKGMGMAMGGGMDQSWGMGMGGDGGMGGNLGAGMGAALDGGLGGGMGMPQIMDQGAQWNGPVDMGAGAPAEELGPAQLAALEFEQTGGAV